VKKIVLTLSALFALGLTIAFAGVYELPEGPGKEIINSKCKACHGLGFIVEGNYTAAQWKKILHDMKTMGLKLSDSEYQKALTYLVTYFGKPGGKESGSAEKTPSDKSSEITPVVKMAPGEQAYNNHCAYCHREKGNGIDGTFPPLNGNRVITKDKAYNIMVMLYGLKGEICVQEGKFYNIMPSWYHLEDKDIAEIINYYLTSWGNKEILAQGITPITASDVAQQRKTQKTAEEVLKYREKISK
jgi:mono/diheme cytochrome c family protein